MSKSKQSIFKSQSKIKSLMFQIIDVLVGVQVINIYSGLSPTFKSKFNFKTLIKVRVISILIRVPAQIH